MNKKLVLAACLLGVSTVVGLQGCSSDAASSGGSSGMAGEAGDTSDAGDKGVGAAGNGGGAAGAAGEGGASAGEGGAEATGDGGAGGAVELTQAELCDQFCTGEFITCVGNLQQYADEAECLTACHGYARGTVGDATGNTLDCRIYHLNLAMSQPTPHCFHTAAVPTAICVDK